MLERDYAEPRSLLTNGLNASIALESETDDYTSATMPQSATPVTTGTTWLCTPAEKPWLASPIFNQTFETVTVVGTRSALNLARVLCGQSNEDTLIEDLSLGTHEAALRFFYQIRQIELPPLDIRPLTRTSVTIKRPLAYKIIRIERTAPAPAEVESKTTETLAVPPAETPVPPIPPVSVETATTQTSPTAPVETPPAVVTPTPTPTPTQRPFPTPSTHTRTHANTRTDGHAPTDSDPSVPK
jgi:hypothetical protein